MKKLLAFTLASVLLLLPFTGCSSEKKGAKESSSTESSIGSTENNSSDESSSDESSIGSTENNSSDGSQNTIVGNNGDGETTEKTKPHRHIMYNKNGKRMYYDFEGSAPWYACDVENSNSLPRLTIDGTKMLYSISSKLFYREVLSEKPAVKIAESVSWYMFEKHGDYIVYNTFNNILYKSDFTKSTEIDRNILFIVEVYNEGEGILYAKLSGDNYDIYNFNGEKSQKVMSGVSECYVNQKNCDLYCIIDKQIHVLHPDLTSKKLTGPATEVQYVTDDGIYYKLSKENATELHFYNIKTNTRTMLSENGTFKSFSSYSTAAVFTAMSKKGDNSQAVYIAVGGKATELDMPKDVTVTLAQFHFDKDANAYFNVLEANDSYSIYKFTASSGKVEQYDIEVSGIAPVKVSEDGNVIYFKGGSDESKLADLYINKEKIAAKVYIDSVDYSFEYKTLIYITDWAGKDKGGKLWYQKKGEQPLKIAENVSEYIRMPSEYIAYIKDKNSGKGTLYTDDFTGNPKKIDDGVSLVSFGQYSYGLA